MLIVCPSCATSYDVELASLLPEGRYVRCRRCHMVWHAEPSHADKLLAAAAALCPELILVDRALAAQAEASQPEPAAEAAAGMAGFDEEEGNTFGGESPMEGESFAAAADDAQPTEVGLIFLEGDDAEAAEDGSSCVLAGGR